MMDSYTALCSNEGSRPPPPRYHFSVRACDVGACGAWSAPLALVPARPDSLFGPTAVTAAGYVEGLLTVPRWWMTVKTKG